MRAASTLIILRANLPLARIMDSKVGPSTARTLVFLTATAEAERGLSSRRVISPKKSLGVSTVLSTVSPLSTFIFSSTAPSRSTYMRSPFSPSLNMRSPGSKSFTLSLAMGLSVGLVCQPNKRHCYSYYLDIYHFDIYYSGMPKENRSKYAILGMLDFCPMSGYDLRKYAASSIGHFWKEDYGHIYPTLKLLLE